MIGDIIKTINGSYKIVFQPGPLSCSVAGGMSPLITKENGEKEFLYLPPGHFLEKIENIDIGIPEVELTITPESKFIIGKMLYRIGTFFIDRDEYWNITDVERQALHDRHDPGSKAIPFNPKFAEQHGKNPEGPF
jgi:hypothetical protein